MKYFVRFVLFGVLNLWAFRGNAQTKKWVFSQPKMGSSFTIQVYSADSLLVANTVAKAFAAVDSLNLAFSDYLPNSELSQLAVKSGQWVKVSKDFFTILQISKKAYMLSDGAFDISLGQLTKTWRKARKTNEFPSKSTIQNARNLTGMQYLELDEKQQRAKITKAGIWLDLGGIGKGYAAQKMMEIMQANGLNLCLCDAAGNMAIGDTPSDKKGWQIAVAMPNNQEQLYDKMLTLKNIAISTSGDIFQFMTHQGKRYSHIIDPKTGFGLQHQRQVTIICKDATEADWLSTACSVLTIQKAKKLAKKMKAKLLILEAKNQKINVIEF